jgi:hypothetical protein
VTEEWRKLHNWEGFEVFKVVKIQAEVFFIFKDKGSMVFQNVDILPQPYTSQLRRPKPECT